MRVPGTNKRLCQGPFFLVLMVPLLLLSLAPPFWDLQPKANSRAGIKTQAGAKANVGPHHSKIHHQRNKSSKGNSSIVLLQPDLDRAFLGHPRVSYMRILFGLSGRATAGSRLLIWADCSGCRSQTRVNQKGFWVTQLPLRLASPYYPTLVHITYLNSSKKFKDGIDFHIQWIDRSFHRKKTHPYKVKHHRPHRPPTRPARPKPSPKPQAMVGMEQSKQALRDFLQAAVNNDLSKYCSFRPSPSGCLADLEGGRTPTQDLGVDPNTLLSQLASASAQKLGKGWGFLLASGVWSVQPNGSGWTVGLGG